MSAKYNAEMKRKCMEARTIISNEKGTKNAVKLINQYAKFNPVDIQG
jgi:hypothetical protein